MRNPPWDQYDTRTLEAAGYVLGSRKGMPFIVCLRCDTRSYKPADIDQLYCRECRKWHAVLEIMK